MWKEVFSTFIFEKEWTTEVFVVSNNRISYSKQACGDILLGRHLW